MNNFNNAVKITSVMILGTGTAREEEEDTLMAWTNI